MGPDVRTVKRHIDRNITDDGDSLFIRVCAEFSPLLVKLILQEFPEVDLVL